MIKNVKFGNKWQKKIRWLRAVFGGSSSSTAVSSQFLIVHHKSDCYAKFQIKWDPLLMTSYNCFQKSIFVSMDGIACWLSQNLFKIVVVSLFHFLSKTNVIFRSGNPQNFRVDLDCYEESAKQKRVNPRIVDS